MAFVNVNVYTSQLNLYSNICWCETPGPVLIKLLRIVLHLQLECSEDSWGAKNLRRWKIKRLKL